MRVYVHVCVSICMYIYIYTYVYIYIHIHIHIYIYIYIYIYMIEFSRRYPSTDWFCCLGVQLLLQKFVLALGHVSSSSIVVLSFICKSFGLVLGHGPVSCIVVLLRLLWEVFEASGIPESSLWALRRGGIISFGTPVCQFWVLDSTLERIWQLEGNQAPSQSDLLGLLAGTAAQQAP